MLKQQRPDLEKEKSLYLKGYSCIAGVDEVGRGAIAGPVVAAAVIIQNNEIIEKYQIDDSKKCSKKKRENIYQILTKNCQFAIAQIKPHIIDEINIHNASLLAMSNAIRKIAEKNEKLDFILVDGKFIPDIQLQAQNIIKGDQKSISIAAASIIAKVYRDKIMDDMHKLLPAYGLDTNKGYPVKKHLAAIEKYGITQQHRLSYKPVRKIADALRC